VETNQDKTRRGQTPCTIIQDIDDFIAVYDPGKHVFLYIGQPENVTDSPWGGLPNKKDGGARQKFWKDPLRGTKILFFVGVAWNVLTPKRYQF